jgi:MFS family permease
MSEATVAKGRYVALVIVMVGVFMSVLDTVALNIALPSITTYFGVDVADTQWVVTGYLLVQTCFLIICGKVAERIGQAKLFNIGLVSSPYPPFSAPSPPVSISSSSSGWRRDWAPR